MNASQSVPVHSSLVNRLTALRLRRSLAFGIIILTALVAFEAFNYSTTDFALSDLLGDLRFLGVTWSTILAIAFCGIDFAGIARLFTPRESAVGRKEPNEVWYLFGAWLLAATMNATLTWWGVSMAVASHSLASSAVIDEGTLTMVVPVFVAVMVWLIRILIIGSLSYTGGHFFSQPERSTVVYTRRPQPVRPAVPVGSVPVVPAQMARPAAQPVSRPAATCSRPEPTYHNMPMQARPNQTGPQRNPPLSR